MNLCFYCQQGVLMITLMTVTVSCSVLLMVFVYNLLDTPLVRRSVLWFNQFGVYSVPFTGCVAAHCLLVVSEDNQTSIGKLQCYSSVLQKLLDLEGSESSVLLLRTLACGEFIRGFILKDSNKKWSIDWISHCVGLWNEFLLSISATCLDRNGLVLMRTK
jgi:hypothetical protein